MQLGFFFCSTKEKNVVYLCTCVCVHACGQSPTVPSQPLRTSGDVSRTKDSMKGGREKRRTKRKGSVKLPFQQCIWMTFVELYFLTNMCLQDYYQSTETNVAKFNMRSKQIWTWIETGFLKDTMFFVQIYNYYYNSMSNHTSVWRTTCLQRQTPQLEASPQVSLQAVDNHGSM